MQRHGFALQNGFLEPDIAFEAFGDDQGIGRRYQQVDRLAGQLAEADNRGPTKFQQVLPRFDLAAELHETRTQAVEAGFRPFDQSEPDQALQQGDGRAGCQPRGSGNITQAHAKARSAGKRLEERIRPRQGLDADRFRDLSAGRWLLSCLS